jgi:hypothetical protein
VVRKFAELIDMNSPNKSPKKWDLTLLDTGDGSGDGYIELPEELLQEIGWIEDDVIDCEIVNGQLRLTKVN